MSSPSGSKSSSSSGTGGGGSGGKSPLETPGPENGGVPLPPPFAAAPATGREAPGAAWPGSKAAPLTVGPPVPASGCAPEPGAPDAGADCPGVPPNPDGPDPGDADPDDPGIPGPGAGVGAGPG